MQNYLEYIEIINKTFSNYLKRSKILAYISHPKVNKNDILHLIEEVKKGCQDLESQKIIENCITNLYNLCMDENVAKKVYKEIYNYSQRNLISLNEDIFKEIFYYILHPEIGKYQREQTRKTVFEQA